MYSRILFRLLFSTSFVLYYGCYDESVPFTEEKVGSYEISSVPDELTNPLENSFVIEEDSSFDALTDEGLVDLIDDGLDDVQAPETDEFAEEEGESIPSKNGKGKGRDKGNSQDDETDQTPDDDVLAEEGNGTDEDDVSGSDEQSGAEPVADVDDEEMSDEAIFKACAKYFKGKAKRISMLSANRGAVTVGAETALAVRVNGNQNFLQLNFAAGEKLAGLCIFASGNQPNITVDSNVDMKQFVYMARGNMSNATIRFHDGHGVDASMVDLRGNDQTILFQGMGNEPCANAQTKGQGHQLTCE